MKAPTRTPALPVAVASLLWFVMFSPWTAPLLPFWPVMAVSSIVLLLLGSADGEWFGLKGTRPMLWRQLLSGIAVAAVLWTIFWAGDKLSSLLFHFARGQVDAVYGMKSGSSQTWVALQLLLLTGPAEELFWRGYVQRKLSQRHGANIGFIAATAIYTLIHIWSSNFMLVMAALTCGIVWGGLYRLRPQWLPALVVSHALWDCCVFVLFPI